MVFAPLASANWYSSSPSTRGICQASSRVFRSSSSSSITARICLSIRMKAPALLLLRAGGLHAAFVAGLGLAVVVELVDRPEQAPGDQIEIARVGDGVVVVSK